MKGFYQTYFDILESAEDCLNKNRITPCLILIYSAIDSFSSLAKRSDSVGKKVFKEWVKKWMLKKYPLPCNETDLYGARCGLIHSHQSESDLSEKGEANKIFYSWGTADNYLLQKSLKKTENVSTSIALKVEDLIYSFRNGFADCFAEIEKDDEWTKTFEERAKKMLLSIDNQIINHNKT